MIPDLLKVFVLLIIFVDGIFHSTASEEGFRRFGPDREWACTLKNNLFAFSVAQHRAIGAFLISGSIVAAVDHFADPFPDSAFWKFLLGVWWYVVVPITLFVIAGSVILKIYRFAKTKQEKGRKATLECPTAMHKGRRRRILSNAREL